MVNIVLRAGWPFIFLPFSLQEPVFQAQTEKGKVLGKPHCKYNFWVAELGQGARFTMTLLFLKIHLFSCVYVCAPV